MIILIIILSFYTIISRTISFHIISFRYNFLCVQLFAKQKSSRSRSPLLLAYPFCDISQTKLSSLTFLSWPTFFVHVYYSKWISISITVYKWTETRIINIIISSKKVYVYAVHKIWNVPKVFANIPL